MEEIFVGSNSSPSLPLLKERCQILNETGEILCRVNQDEKLIFNEYFLSSSSQIYQGHFHHCIEQCGGNAVDLLQIIVREFPSYRDETFYHGQKGFFIDHFHFHFHFQSILINFYSLVSFYKRAQILINDIWGYFNGHSYGHFQDLVNQFISVEYQWGNLH